MDEVLVGMSVIVIYIYIYFFQFNLIINAAFLYTLADVHKSIWRWRVSESRAGLAVLVILLCDCHVDK